MTQPDLVSKLREVIAKVKPLVEKATPMPWSTNSQFIPQASAKILVGSDRRSIAYVGMNPQSKEWETYAQDITNTLLIIAAVNAMDELESLLGQESQTANECQYCNRGIERKLVGVHWVHPIGQEQFECRYSTLDVPTSTPIVPGTAGLSAFADEIKLLLKMAEDCDARGEVQSPQKEWTFYQGKIVAYKHILSLLGAAKPVGISIDALEDLMQQFKQREARIRKDVVEVVKKTFGEAHPAQAIFPQILDRALAERPVPAGEVKRT